MMVEHHVKRCTLCGRWKSPKFCPSITKPSDFIERSWMSEHVWFSNLTRMVQRIGEPGGYPITICPKCRDRPIQDIFDAVLHYQMYGKYKWEDDKK